MKTFLVVTIIITGVVFPISNLQIGQYNVDRIDCSGYSVNSFMFYVCNSIHNKIIQSPEYTDYRYCQ